MNLCLEVELKWQSEKSVTAKDPEYHVKYIAFINPASEGMITKRENFDAGKALGHTLKYNKIRDKFEALMQDNVDFLEPTLQIGPVLQTLQVVSVPVIQLCKGYYDVEEVGPLLLSVFEFCVPFSCRVGSRMALPAPECRDTLAHQLASHWHERKRCLQSTAEGGEGKGNK